MTANPEETAMIAEYDAWLAAHPQYEPMSADELQAEIAAPYDCAFDLIPNETDREAVKWLGDYCLRWEAMMQRAGY